ncbi:helix-turn-helix domain-containing protein [Nocardia asiatica]|uniref:helix-turn-helix domain-containing protein n=1 Tax=Nocardia asiatica TaxID=209252 RepID=UPI0024564711|nr:helix-turn-helix transcriptional regulator [Nocardia asiatica]
MGRAPDHLHGLSASGGFGAELRRRREAGGYSLANLGRLVHVSGDLIGKIEKGQRTASHDLIRRLDDVLGAAGALVGSVHRPQPRAEDVVLTTKHAAAAIPWARRTRRPLGQIAIETPAGQRFTGTSIPALVLPADSKEERILLDGGSQRVRDHARIRSGLVVAAVETNGSSRYFGLSARASRQQELLLPRVYELDEITLGMLWAVSNLDEGLLDSDTELDAAVAVRHFYDGATASAISRDDTLSLVAQMWLGSDFCARHILRHADRLGQTPLYWTSEQTGEEASAWLLFAHKLEYLQETAARHAAGTPSIRAFHVSPDPSGTMLPERILLLLAAALMESFRIRVAVCPDPLFDDTPGFVLDPGATAILANWVRSDDVWLVDITDKRTTVRQFADVIGHATAHSAIDAPEPLQRLHRLAQYLDIDWNWVTRRCRGLAGTGIAGLVRPRSRLLSLAGLERACAFLGMAAVAGG